MSVTKDIILKCFIQNKNMETRNHVFIVIVSVYKVLLNTCAVERGRGTRVDKHCFPFKKAFTLEVEMLLIENKEV